jgi:hypothetical protein
MTRELEVYNLEFEWPDEKMEIGSYAFLPSEDYWDRYLRMQHLGGPHGSIEACTGSHQITGTVQCPDNPRPAALGWGHDAPTELDDILLLLSLFTRRKVFVLAPREVDEVVIADPRMFHYGGGLRLSLGRETRMDESGEEEHSINLVGGLSKVNQLIRSNTWRSTYGNGRFLFLFGSACHRQILETSFLLCWTAWEHLFALHNASTMSKKKIEKVHAKKKLAYILVSYGVKQSVPAAHKTKLAELVKIRNSLVHDGMFPTTHAQEVADIFIRLTEIVIARILGLEPSNVFSAEERFDRFLNDQQLI